MQWGEEAIYNESWRELQPVPEYPILGQIATRKGCQTVRLRLGGSKVYWKTSNVPSSMGSQHTFGCSSRRFIPEVDPRSRKWHSESDLNLMIDDGYCSIVRSPWGNPGIQVENRISIELPVPQYSIYKQSFDFRRNLINTSWDRPTSWRNKKLSYRLETGYQQCIFVAKLLSIAVMTYTYVYHLRNLRPMIRLNCYP